MVLLPGKSHAKVESLSTVQKFSSVSEMLVEFNPNQKTPTNKQKQNKKPKPKTLQLDHIRLSENQRSNLRIIL